MHRSDRTHKMASSENGQDPPDRTRKCKHKSRHKRMRGGNPGIIIMRSFAKLVLPSLTFTGLHLLTGTLSSLSATFNSAVVSSVSEDSDVSGVSALQQTSQLRTRRLIRSTTTSTASTARGGDVNIVNSDDSDDHESDHESDQDRNHITSDVLSPPSLESDAGADPTADAPGHYAEEANKSPIHVQESDSQWASADASAADAGSTGSTGSTGSSANSGRIGFNVGLILKMNHNSPFLEEISKLKEIEICVYD
jgi:hypothetical protein